MKAAIPRAETPKVIRLLPSHRVTIPVPEAPREETPAMLRQRTRAAPVTRTRKTMQHLLPVRTATKLRLRLRRKAEIPEAAAAITTAEIPGAEIPEAEITTAEIPEATRRRNPKSSILAAHFLSVSPKSSTRPISRPARSTRTDWTSRRLPVQPAHR